MQPFRLEIKETMGEYSDKLLLALQLSKKNLRDGLREEGKILGSTMIAFTPPQSGRSLSKVHGAKFAFNAGLQGEEGLEKAGAKRIGERRVEKDIRRVILGIEDKSVQARIREREKVIKGQPEVVRIFVDRNRVVYGADIQKANMDATIKDLHVHHQAQRTSRGRVTEAGTRTRNIGRWKFMNQLIVPEQLLREYIREVKQRVGRARGGWAGAVQHLGGKVAQWVLRHKAAGTYKDGLDRANPYFTFTNLSEWASGNEADRITANAIRARIKHLTATIEKATTGGLKTA